MNAATIAVVRQELNTRLAAHPGEQFTLSPHADRFARGRRKRIDETIAQAAGFHLNNQIDEAVASLQLVRALFRECPEALLVEWHNDDQPWTASAVPLYQVLQKLCRIGYQSCDNMLLRQFVKLQYKVERSQDGVNKEQAAAWTQFNNQVAPEYEVNPLLGEAQVGVLKAVYQALGADHFYDEQHCRLQYIILESAVQASNLPAVSWLLVHFRGDLVRIGDTTFNSGSELLHAAARHGSMQIMRHLLLYIHETPAMMQAVLWTAAQYNRLEVIQYLTVDGFATIKMLRQCRNRLKGQFYDDCYATKVGLTRLIRQTIV